MADPNSFGVVEVLKALHLLDSKREIKALEKKLARLRVCHCEECDRSGLWCGVVWQ